MNKAETAKIIDILQINYPDSFKGKDENSLIATVSLWQKVFADDDYQTVSAAVMAHIATDTNRFMPPVGVIKNALVTLTTAEEMTESEAWAHVAKAIRRSAYYAKEEFDKLPPICQRLVGSPAQLKEWAVCERPDTMSVAQSNFMRSYRARAKTEREYAALPSAVKSLMIEARQQLALGDGSK